MQKDYFIEFHVAGFCFKKVNNEFQILCAKRTNTRRRLPNLWECGGGRIRPEDEGYVFNAIKRQLAEELNVKVKPLFIAGQYRIEAQDLPQKYIFGVKILCEFQNYIQGDSPRLDPHEHSECKWQPLGKLNELNFIKGIPEEIKKAMEIYKKIKN